MAPVVYKDVQNSAKNLLKDDYNFDRKFKLSQKASNGVAFTTEGVLTAKGTTEGKLSAKFKIDSVSVDKLQTTTSGRINAEVSIKDALPGLSVGVKVEDGVAGSGNPAGSVNATYKYQNITAFAEVDVVDGPTIYDSVTCEYQNFTVGAEVKVNTHLDDKDSKPALVDANAVVAYQGKDFHVSLATVDMLKKLSLAIHHTYDAKTNVATTLDLETKGALRTLTVGATRKVDENTAFSGKIDSKGVVSANYIQVLRPEVKLIASASVDAKNFAADSHKFGLALILG